VNKEKRQFKRYEVSIPCTITHEGEPIRGRITDISMGGVLITELTGPPPPEEAFITVNFQVDQMALTQRNVAIEASVDSNVVRNLFAIQDDEIVGSIGVKFQDHSLKGQSQLKSIMHLISEQSAQQEAQTVPEDLSSPSEMSSGLQSLRRLRKLANAIRKVLQLGEQKDRDFGSQEEDEGEAPEGKILFHLHRVRERNPSLVRRKKKSILEKLGHLRCEVCGFDFQKAYGELGEGFIECHHTIPVSKLKSGSRTRLNDLSLVCSNCHRMLHRGGETFSIDDLRKVLDK